MRRLRFVVPLLLSLSLGSCMGAIYQHTTSPLSVNFRDTPVGASDGKSDMKELNLSFIYVRLMWDGNDIATAARKAGVKEIHYADFEQLRILGIWNQTWVHVYGR